MDKFLHFYETLFYKIKTCNIRINDLKSIILSNSTSKPVFASHQIDVRNMSCNLLYSLLSKAETLPFLFTEGHNSVKRVTDRYFFLEILLYSTHENLRNVWAANLPMLLYVSCDSDINKHTIAMDKFFMS